MVPQPIAEASQLGPAVGLPFPARHLGSYHDPYTTFLFLPASVTSDDRHRRFHYHAQRCRPVNKWKRTVGAIYGLGSVRTVRFVGDKSDVYKSARHVGLQKFSTKVGFVADESAGVNSAFGGGYHYDST